MTTKIEIFLFKEEMYRYRIDMHGVSVNLCTYCWSRAVYESTMGLVTDEKGHPVTIYGVMIHSIEGQECFMCYCLKKKVKVSPAMRE